MNSIRFDIANRKTNKYIILLEQRVIYNICMYIYLWSKEKKRDGYIFKTEKREPDRVITNN